MKKPTLSDFNLTEASLQEQRRQRSRWRAAWTLLSILVVIVYWWVFVVVAPEFIEFGWIVIIALFLTFWGLVPAAAAYAVLDTILGERFLYGEATRYEAAIERYNEWFARTQAIFWDALSGRQFEYEVARLLTKVGYSARLTPASGDQGVDVRLADGTIIQCKAHRSPVGPAVARELYGTLQHFQAPRAILVSKNGFTRGVYVFVSGKPIELWDVRSLIDMQKQLDT